MRRKTINNSAKCEGCEYCEIFTDNGLETVHCSDKDRKWIFGQVIESCENYKSKKKDDAH